MILPFKHFVRLPYIAMCQHQFKLHLSKSKKSYVSIIEIVAANRRIESGFISGATTSTKLMRRIEREYSSLVGVTPRARRPVTKPTSNTVSTWRPNAEHATTGGNFASKQIPRRLKFSNRNSNNNRVAFWVLFFFIKFNLDFLII